MDREKQTRRWEVALGLAAAVLLVLVGYHVLIDYTRSWDYNAVRLQRTFVLLAGAPIYPARDAGAILNSIYGPVGAAAYLPAAAMRSPASAVLAGQVLAALFFFLPVAVLHRRQRRGLMPVFAFLLFAALALDMRSLEYVAFSIHVDAPALGLAILAWGLIASGGARHDGLASVLISLAVWTKLTLLPLLVVAPVWVFVARGRRQALQLTARLALALVLVSATMALFFGPVSDLVFNMWTLPSLQTLEAEPAAWGRAVYRLLKENAAAWLLWAGLVVWRLARHRSSWHADPACSFGAVGLALAPLAVLAFLKPGGDINAFSYPVYFIAAGATLSLVRVARREVLARRILVIAPAAVLAIVAAVQEPEFLRTWREPLNVAELPHQIAYEYLLEHPGEIYFPRITLASLMAEGEVYHQSVGLLDRKVAGIPPSAKHLRAHVPAAMVGVAFYENGFASEIELIDLPEFSSGTYMPELPGFVVYRREPGGPKDPEEAETTAARATPTGAGPF